MALTLERRLVWKTEAFESDDTISPLFYFQNCEWRFEMRYSSANEDEIYNHSYFDLYMVSTSGQELPQPFWLTSYFENDEIGCHLCKTQEVTDTTSGIRGFYEDEIDWRGEITIVMIFHDKIGLTLRLASEKEKFRNVAVDTSTVSDSKRPLQDAELPTCGHFGLEILSQDISKLLEGDLYQDVVVKCGDQAFKAHRAVLCTRSEVFLAMLQSDMLEGQTAQVEVKDMKSDVCKELLHYMYSGQLPELTLEKAKGLYEAGDRFNVGGLMKPCAEFLTKNLSPDNACEMLALADAHSDQNFKESIVEYILEKKIPRKDDIWQNFCCSQPVLATEVLNKFYKLQVN